jgi:hypothetical protein
VRAESPQLSARPPGSIEEQDKPNSSPDLEPVVKPCPRVIPQPRCTGSPILESIEVDDSKQLGQRSLQCDAEFPSSFEASFASPESSLPERKAVKPPPKDQNHSSGSTPTALNQQRSSTGMSSRSRNSVERVHERANMDWNAEIENVSTTSSHHTCISSPLWTPSQSQISEASPEYSPTSQDLRLKENHSRTQSISEATTERNRSTELGFDVPGIVASTEKVLHFIFETSQQDLDFDHPVAYGRG